MPNLVRLRAFGWWNGYTGPYGWPGEFTSIQGTVTPTPTPTTTPTTTTPTQPPAQPPKTQTSTVTTAIVVTSPVVITASPEPSSTPSTPASSPTDTSSESGNSRSITSRSSGRSFSSSTSRSDRASPTSVADHAPSESPASESVVYHTVSGTVTQTVSSVASGPTIVANTTASQSRSMNSGEKAAIAIACILVFLLPVVIWFMRRKRKSQREHQRIHSPTDTISGGMIYIGPRRSNGAVRDTIDSQGATIHSLSIDSSRFSTSDDGHAARVVAAAAYPDEKSPSAFASPPGSSRDAYSASPRSSSPLLSPRSSVPLISPASPISPMSPMVSMAHMSQIMPYGYAPGPLPLAHMAPLSPVHPMPNFPFITSPTTAATERLPYAWDNPPPSSEYLPGSRRSTFRTSRYASRDLASGFPSPPYGAALPEDARSERSAPPMYSRD
ncbi:hypothetical protein C8Q74DRAFT_1370523 [Fomes fomentarius]|nr:hypothetical protein C8Q74DRAFT_1370523 [Fomes fomentarius]